jgi:hypothetical protein
MRLLKALIVSIPMLMICTSSAYAEYSYQLVIPPDAENASLLGINNAGKVVGRVSADSEFLYGFVYDMKSGVFTNLEEGFNAVGISTSGVMVGSNADGICTIRDKDGTFTTFFPPSYTPGSFCTGRAVNPDGKVSGFVVTEVDEIEIWTGFIYDSEYGTFEEFLPSLQTIAQGIDAQGQNVGSVFLFSGEAYPGSPPGRYAYLREADESIKYFAINQSAPGQSRARGISNNGLLSGFYRNPVTSEFTGYATTVPDGEGFETIVLTADEVVHRRPCDPDLPPPPDGYVILTDVFIAAIRTDGVVVGQCADYHYNPTTGDLISFNNYGLIATPIAKDNQGGGNCLPPPEGMTSWWPGDGNSIDIVGGLDGEFIDDATTGPGLADWAFTLDGDGDFINVAHDPGVDLGTGDFTVDLWVNFNDTSGEQVLVEKWVQGDGFVDGWTLTKLDGNVLRLALEIEEGIEADLDSYELPIVPGLWYHFAATREGDTFTLFMNGEVIAQDDFEGELNLDSASSLKFGHRGNVEDTPGSIDTRDFYVNGRIDEVELFAGTALSEEQIMDLYVAGGDGKCKRGL